MMHINILMNAYPEKRRELSQAIASLSDAIGMETGCQRCDFFHGMEDENQLLLFEEWDTEENLKAHLKSERFGVLRGAMNILLKEPYEMTLYTIFHPADNSSI